MIVIWSIENFLSSAMGINIPSSVFPAGSFRSLWLTKRIFAFSRRLVDKHERAQVHTPRVRALRCHKLHGLPRTASRFRREVAVETASKLLVLLSAGKGK